MTREEAKEFYPILQAYAEGKVIECRTKPSALSKSWQDMNDWTEMKDISFWDNIEYRIKPDSKAEAKYRPFKDAEECWTEMLKHQPFGWVKHTSYNEYFYSILEVVDGGCVFVYGPMVPFDEAYEFNTFADGTPFGIKE